MKCNKAYRLSFTERAKDIVSKMSLEEKVYLMSGNMTLQDFAEDMKKGLHYNEVPYPAGGNEEKGVPPMMFCDGPRGAVQGNSTCFPVSMARGATFDTELEERIGRAIGKEIRAHGGNLFGGVCINLPYNPGWGRSQETYGEDSFHIGQMGSALVRGIQEENVIACIKHYAFNSMEISRFKVNVTADKRTEREVYLSHFKDCIDAGAACVMSAYNLYQGVHCGHSDYLLRQVLKGEWDFDGFVISDFIWGVKDTVEAANAGMDIEMCATRFFGDKLVEAVKKGEVREEVIDEAAVRIVRTLLAFTEADDREYGKELIGSKEHIALALEAAEKSMTLMQNRNNLLPLDRNKIKRLALSGKLAVSGNIGDHGSSRVYPEYIVTPLEGLKNTAPGIELLYDDGQDLEKAKELVKSADAVVFVLGYDHDDEGEYIAGSFSEEEGIDLDITAVGGGSDFLSVGGDRKESLGLHREDIELIKNLGPLNRNSVVVLIGGNMIMIDEWKDDVSSILMAYYPGMEGGTAIARTLFGEVNPGGKLPFVVPCRESDLPQVDWDTTGQFYEYYHGYAKLEKEGIKPLLPFGFGLSYTTFEFTNPVFTTDGEYVKAACEVRNTGGRKGDEVVQMYVGFRNSAIDRPVKVLRGFKRISLEPGEKKTIEISCPVERLKWFNPETNEWELEHMEYEVYIGNSSSNDDLLMGTVTL
ncbi:MAG: glycosyl hydrolase [Halanaerobiaceae bacterium]|nr:glycosyl hydrolase [Halanaerobiaceae bacterium]